MTVFVAGIHGVGKTYLCRQYAETFGVRHESSSELIRRALSHPEWDRDKKTSNIDGNQSILQGAVQKIVSSEALLLLDGHFVLINKAAEIVPIDTSVYEGLSLSGVVLLEARPELIISRIKDRDSVKTTFDIESLLQAERAHAQLTCRALEITLEILHEPTFSVFSKSVKNLF